MFGIDHYVPILKWKRGEQKALKETTATAKSRITPLLEIVEVPCDLDDDTPTKTVEDHVEPAVEKIPGAWGVKRRFFLDPWLVSGNTTGGKTGAECAFDKAASLNLKFIPVTGLDRPKKDIAAALKHANEGLCLRLLLDDVPGFPATVDKFIKDHKLDRKNVDLVLDLGSVNQLQPSMILAVSKGFISAIPSVADWRTMTLAASSFPDSMGVVQANNTLLLPRNDWIAWLALKAQKLPRTPTYGDYAIQHPTGVEGFDPRYMHSAAAIRYTLDKQWYLLKGSSTKITSTTLQFPGLAATLQSSVHFMGVKHCKGCADVAACAGGAASLGSPEVWRRIGTTHHLAVVCAAVTPPGAGAGAAP